MESSILGLIVDSSIAIEAERQHFRVAELLKRIVQEFGDTHIALSAFTVAELAHGIYRADNAERRERRREFLDDLIASVPVYSFTQSMVEPFGKISAGSAAKGVVIPIDDLLIAACALERGYAMLTRNIRHFERVPDLRLVRF